MISKTGTKTMKLRQKTHETTWQSLKTRRWKMSNEIQKVESKQVSNLSPEALIQHAIDKGVPVETMERLLAMRTQLKQEAAREAYFEDMKQLQSECPVIQKKTEGGKTNSGTVAYYYAPLEQIVEETKDLREKYGFSHTFDMKEEGDKVIATCTVNHVEGHSESSSVTLPLASKTSVMSNPQVYGATISYAKRYAFLNAFGITVGGEDKEEKLQEEEFKAGAMEEYGKKLMEAKDMDELKKVWIELPAIAKKELTKLKEDVKKALTQEK